MKNTRRKKKSISDIKVNSGIPTRARVLLRGSETRGKTNDRRTYAESKKDGGASRYARRDTSARGGTAGYIPITPQVFIFGKK